MSQKIINKSLQKTLISPLTSDLLWTQFLDANSYEIANMENRYTEIKNVWNINKNDKQNLIRISESFGYTPNLIINNTLNMCKMEIESIPYRIREKTTYKGYALIFHQNNLRGNTFNYYWNGEKLIKSIDYDSTINNLKNSNHYSPFYDIVAVKNYSSVLNSITVILDYLFENEIIYDEYGVRYYSLDQKFNPYWKLDTPYMKTPTSHLGIEYFPSTYYCKYYGSLGIATEELNEYTTTISLYKYYIEKSIKIIINKKELNLSFTDDNKKEYIIDAEGILNEESYYDKSNGNLYLKFNIIPIGHEIIVSYDIDLFMTSDYFYYLEQGMEYNKRCPIIPHTGVFLTVDIAQSRGSDFYYPNEEHYTIPDLKIKALTTSAYNRNIILSKPSKLDNAKNAEGQPSGENNYKLDDVIKWYLDTSTKNQESMANNFKYIACGNHALPIINEENYQIFNQSEILFYYNLNGEDTSSIINDSSQNQLNCTIVGDTVKINGIIDKSLNFDGETYAYSTSSLSIDSSRNYCLGIWFNADNESSVSIETIFDNFIDIEYDYENEKLIIDSTQIDCLKNQPHFLCMNFHSNDSTIDIYLDNVLADTILFTIIASSAPIYIGADSSADNKFHGIIDNLWFLSKNLQENEISYVYENKITVISHMGNRLAYYNIMADEISENQDYYLIQSYVKGKDVVNETINVSDGEIYEFRTKNYPIKNPYFDITYYNTNDILVVIKSNEKGEFYNADTNEMITGSINFLNGKCQLTKNTIKSVSQYKIKEPNRLPIEHGFYEDAYHIIENEESNEWYTSYDNVSGEFYDKIYPNIVDDVIYTEDNFDSKILEYYDEDDVKQKNSDSELIYTIDEENYYVKNNNDIYDENDKIYIKKYTVNLDSEETPLFSSNEGKHLYYNLDDLKTQELTENPIYLKCYIELGEATGTYTYTYKTTETIEIGGEQVTLFVRYLDVKSACSNDTSKIIRKWYGTSEGITYVFYTLGDDVNIRYSDLSFTSILDINFNNYDREDWNPMEITIKCSETDWKLELIKTIANYKNNVYALNYISNINYTVTVNDTLVTVVKDSMYINYWLEEDGKLVKEKATVNINGEISGKNISSGSFNYETSVLTLTFQNKVKSEVVISFEYYYTLDIDISRPLVLNYKLEESKINEIGLENENHELLAYMTFPDIEFHSIYNNVSAMFAISKTN